MRIKHVIKQMATVMLLISLCLSGCSKKDDSSDNKTSTTDVNDSVVENNNSEEISGEAKNDAENAAENSPQTETQDEGDEVTEEIVPREEWEVAKLSGSKEAFEDYFNPDMKDYSRSCENSGEVQTIIYYSEVMGAERSAQVYTPYGYDAANTYPVIYLIHGIGCDSSQWVSMSVANIFDHMIDKGELNPFIAVFPSVIPVGGLDPVSVSDTNIQAFIDFVKEFKEDLHPYVIENFSASELREDTAICGLSMGGMEALRLGFTYLDTFNYIGSFSAAPTLETELLTTESSDYIPKLVLICSGDKDGTVGDNPYNYHSVLSDNGVDHIWYVHPGQGHSGGVWKLGLFNFLKRLSGGFIGE
ncbi:MAG: esterase family protein [Lachnospiraceae bacterium]|nr:esterase family protein [Lachnospiraceae bacterium]